MSDMFTQDFIFNALKVSIIMGLLLSYLGVHVVGRESFSSTLPSARSRCSALP